MDEWIDTTQAAELSNLPVEEIRRLIRNHEIAAHKRGKYFWIHKSSLVQYMAAHDRPVAATTLGVHDPMLETSQLKTPDTLQLSVQGIDFAGAYTILIEGYLRRHFPKPQGDSAEDSSTS